MIKGFVYYLGEKLTRTFFLLLTYVIRKDTILFIPHEHMCINDHYSIINYRSDNALTFARYILDKKLLSNKKIAIGISTTNSKDLYEEFCMSNYKREIEFIYPFAGDNFKDKMGYIKRRLRFYWLLVHSSHVFTSQTTLIRPITRSKRIKVINLGYYTAPIKDSTHDKKNPLYIHYEDINHKDFDYYVVTSEVSKRLICATYGFEYDQYLTLGMCRNDYLFSSKDEEDLKKKIISKLNYEVKTILLYTPTHRDYDKKEITSNSIVKEIFGFEADIKEIEDYLTSHGVLIICKIHPRQNANIDRNGLPRSIMIFEPNDYYGLAELMKLSDALITDYTSGYFDYLILNKPVIFNFADLTHYESTRGLVFNPIEPICAGEMVCSWAELKKAIANLDSNTKDFANKRADILNMLYKNADAYSCNRIYDYFFN